MRRVHVRPPGATPVDEPTRAVFPAAMAHDRAGRAKFDAELARLAGARWTVEETFQGGKGLTGLDEHQGS